MTNPGLWLVGLAAMLCVAQAAGAQEARLPRREVPGLDFRRDGVWRKQARAVRATRALLLGQRRFGELNAPLAAGAPAPSPAAVAGTLDVPVVLLRYTGTTAPPFAAADYDAVLFGATAPFGRPYTYHSFYSDLSNGLLDIQGASYGWTTLSGTEGAYNGGTSAECQQNNPYGTSNCNGVWSDAAFGALQGALREALANIGFQSVHLRCPDRDREPGAVRAPNAGRGVRAGFRESSLGPPRVAFPRLRDKRPVAGPRRPVPPGAGLHLPKRARWRELV